MKKILVILLLSVMTISCQSQSNPKVKIIAPDAFKTAISKGEVQLVDVRTSEEFSEGAIAHALNINVNGADFETEIQKLDKTQPVYIYCRSGARSQTAAKKMVDFGFTEVIDLEGGYLNWKQ
ncbi:rhodanese-like domain-containing protein [Flavobacterium sp. UBA6135]|uniref:rhodanese-like domain-containing protein n=1 Tax=Flavobacterium sp. UBA6135 TaxID=1946553 RepID=UPI0025C053D6|nr:rhodanese-like domain-containing protein [Flavobacterium sp. UBA6135]